MDADKLDQLLIDHALGALAPDVAALLDEHVRRNPQAQQRLTELRETTDLAGALLQEAEPTDLPPLRLGALRNAERSAAWMLRMRHAGSLAAALVLGIVLGSSMLRPAPAPKAGPAQTDNTARITAAGSREAHDTPGLWSRERLYERARRTPERRAARLEWTSPIKHPVFGGDA